MAREFNLKAIISVRDRFSPALKRASMVGKRYRRELKGIGRALGGLARRAAGVTGLASLFGAGSLAAMGAGVAKIVSVSSEFEKLETILTTVLGSSEAAAKSMDWVTDFAARTPYELQQVSEAFVRLNSYGIDATNGSLRAAGDAAAAMGKDVMQAVEALADATTGENERLKEFGIVARTVGDQITYSWSENGKEFRAVADKNNKEMIEKTLSGIWNRRFGGAMEKLSSTWAGMWSNLQDTVTRAIKRIGDAGLFDAVKGHLRSVLDTLGEMDADGSLGRLADTISGELTAAINALVEQFKRVDVREVVTGITEIGGATITVIGWLGDLVKFIRDIPGIWEQAIANTSANLEAVFGSRFPVIIERFARWFRRTIGAMWDWLVGDMKRQINEISRFVDRVSNGFSSGVDKVKGWFGGDDDSSSRNMPTGAPLGAATRVNGEMRVRFENAPAGMRVEPGTTSEPGFDLMPDVGYRREAIG